MFEPEAKAALAERRGAVLQEARMRTYLQALEARRKSKTAAAVARDSIIKPPSMVRFCQTPLRSAWSSARSA